MIRLGSLAGYSFDGPRLLTGWSPPNTAAVFVILYKPEPESRADRYAVIYAGHADDLATARLPFKHPRAPCWISRAGSKFKLHIATFEVPGGGRAHRELIVSELAAVYHPHCNEQAYAHAWRDEWIGEYSSAPTTRPLNPPEPG